MPKNLYFDDVATCTRVSATCTFCNSELTALLGLVSRSPMCFYLVNGELRTQILQFSDSEM